MSNPLLYDYQMDAVKKMKNGCILNGGVGSGKSRTSLAYYSLQELPKNYSTKLKKPVVRDLYIITTAHKRDTHEWEGELVPFGMYTDPEHDLYNHKVVIDSWNNIKKYKDVYGAFFIFDEQRVVGSGAWVKAFLNIARKNKWILLSATPGDKWEDYIPVFIANGFYKNKTELVREHFVYSRFSKFPKVERYINEGKLIKFKNSILINMDFQRETVAHHEDIFVPYDLEKYKNIKKRRWNPWKDKPIETASEYCQCLRKVVNEDDSRQLRLLQIVEEHPRVIVFYNYNYERDILKGLYYGEDVVVAEWNGFEHNPVPNSERWVYLVQYTAGCEGWNCVRTDTMVFYSQNYSYKVMVQAAGRIDRLTTPYKDLYYYHLKSHADIDIMISRALKAKKKFNEGDYYGKS